MTTHVAVELERKELVALAEFWLEQARAQERAGNKIEASEAFERACRLGDLQHKVD
jgi:hypothetical protein